MDGTCRIWEARLSTAARHTLSPTAQFGQAHGALFHTQIAASLCKSHKQVHAPLL